MIFAYRYDNYFFLIIQWTLDYHCCRWDIQPDKLQTQIYSYYRYCDRSDQESPQNFSISQTLYYRLLLNLKSSVHMIYFSLITRRFFLSVKDTADLKLVPLQLSLFGPFVRKLIILPAVYTCPRHFELKFPGIIDEKGRSLFFRDTFWFVFKWLLLKQLGGKYSYLILSQ